MSGRIPPYGKLGFRLERRPYGDSSSIGRLAPRAYVLKIRPTVSIRSTADSEHWQIYLAGPRDAWFPARKVYDTLGEAMAIATQIHEGFVRLGI